MKNNKIRMSAIDIIRGISIFLMIWDHTFNYWLKKESQWIHPFLFFTLNLSGATQFIFVSGISFSFSWIESQKNNLKEKEIIMKSISRTIILAFISLIYNIIVVIRLKSSWVNVWSWNILQTLVITKLLGIIIIRIRKYWKVLIIMLSVIVSNIILIFIIPNKNSNLSATLIYYIFYNPVHANGLFLAIPFFIMGMIVGEIFQKLYRYKLLNEYEYIDLENVRYIFLNLVKKIIYYGIFTLTIGILLGLTPIQSEMDYFNMINELEINPNIKINYLPMFLFPNNYANTLYYCGWQLILAGIIVYLVDFRCKRTNFLSFYKTYGKYSLTIYILQYPILLIIPIVFPAFRFNYYTIWIPLIVLMLFFWRICIVIERKSKGMISMEFCIIFLSGYIYDNLMKNKRINGWKVKEISG